jgi:amphi-Trp domain-containing protein
MAKSDKKQAKQQAKAARQARKLERKQQRRKAQAVLSRSEVADQLRALASQVESGTIVLGDKEMALPAHVDFELSYKPKKWGGHQFEVEIEWGQEAAASLLPTE